MLTKFKSSMKLEFDMTDLGEMKFFLGIEVLQRVDGIFICQRKYASEILDRFGMMDVNVVHNPLTVGFKVVKDEDGLKIDSTQFKQIVGSLMYLSATRPDIMFAVSLISRFMSSPTQLHFSVAKRILRYIKATMDYGVFYKRGSSSELIGYADSDYTGDQEDSKSTSEYVFMMGEGAVAWSSRKQPIVTLSSTEAEYVAAVGCACQAIWMKKVLKEIGQDQEECVTNMCDNTSTIKFSKNSVFHGRTKHIRVRIEKQLADIMTKALKLDSFQGLRKGMGVKAASELN
ncbi:uncharacterized mitochondrial protein AtMg00810-like [Rutidosis leptorrhynchoides]|uniref:uncharacterized mitochondrial protein AtMg00810-like n=1 Tax=Rutidosis leptorrhynchoides TaxID=125765 RepID=UPI003A98DCA8